MYQNKKPYTNDASYRTPKFSRESNTNQDFTISTYPHKYRYIPSTGKVIREYSTMKLLKEASDTIKQQQKAEEEKRKHEEEQEKQEAFLQKIAQFIHPREEQTRPSPNQNTTPTSNFSQKMENIVTIDMLAKQKEDIIATITQVIRENQTSFYPTFHHTPFQHTPSLQHTPSTGKYEEKLENKYGGIGTGIEMDRKAWTKLITNKLNKLKAKKDWPPAIETLRKRFKHEIELSHEGLNKKDAIGKLEKRFTLYGSPSEDLLYEEKKGESRKLDEREASTNGIEPTLQTFRNSITWKKAIEEQKLTLIKFNIKSQFTNLNKARIIKSLNLMLDYLHKLTTRKLCFCIRNRKYEKKYDHIGHPLKYKEVGLTPELIQAYIQYELNTSYFQIRKVCLKQKKWPTYGRTQLCPFSLH